MHLFQLAQELGLEVASLQEWLRAHGFSHDDPLARLDNRAVTAARSAHPIAAIPDNLAVSQFRVEGFKAFGVGQEVPFAPITLVFGPNSSGKSSLLHSLLWANHAATTGELDVIHPVLAGDTVNLGGFKTTQYRREGKAINLSFDIPPDQSPGKLRVPGTLRVHLSFVRKLQSDDLDDVVEDFARISQGEESAAKPVLSRMSIELDGLELLRGSNRPDGRLRLDKVDFDHPFWAERIDSIALGRTYKPTLSDIDRQKVRHHFEQVVPLLAFVSNGLTPGTSVHDDIEPILGDPSDSMAPAADEFIRLVEWIVRAGTESTRRWLGTLRYLGPLRTYPDRGWALTDQRDNHWLAGGGEAWEAVKKSKEVRDYVNRFLIGAGYVFQQRKYLEHERAKDAAEEIVSEAIAALGQDTTQEGFEDPRDRPIDLFSKGAEVLRDVVITDTRNNIPVSPRDIGVGISQVVPVLALSYGLKEKTILIEQPEIHVHPKLQADLGDVFLEAALQPALMRNRFIIETHSEHLILRILKRIRQTSAGEVEMNRPEVRPEDVSVIYAEPTKEGTKLHHLRITPDGDFADRWPHGFFSERGAELFS